MALFKATSPLKGLKVLELAGLAPVPMVGRMLCDFGADVIRVDRPTQSFPDPLAFGKRSITINLQHKQAHTILEKLIRSSDVLLDPYRPGTLESWGYSFEHLQQMNPKLIVTRLTGYGGDLYENDRKNTAGHDINYLAMSGLLSQMSPSASQSPTFPLNVLGDFAGGSAIAFSGTLMALLQRERTQQGALVDASITAGTAYLGSLIYNINALDVWPMVPFLRPGGAPYYDTYATKDGKFIAVGAIEPQFYKQFVDGLASLCNTPETRAAAELLQTVKQLDTSRNADLRKAIETIVKAYTSAELCETFRPNGQYADACVTPVVSISEGAAFAGAQASLSPFVPHAPRIATQTTTSRSTVEPENPKRIHPAACIVPAGTHTVKVLQLLGYSEADIATFIETGVVKDAKSK